MRPPLLPAACLGPTLPSGAVDHVQVPRPVNRGGQAGVQGCGQQCLSDQYGGGGSGGGLQL
uniref:Uncharacterized protein n=1 Tax=Anguilla anguilla TaxID=7936 RepID=A0A0E9U8L2_ANGAN